MKILFIARYINTSGVSTHMLTVGKGLISKGHKVALMSGGPIKNARAEKLFAEFDKNGFEIIQVPFLVEKTNKIKEGLSYLISLPIGLKRIREFNPDIIHVHWPVTSYLAKLYTKITGKKFVTTYHTSGIPKHFLHRKADYAIAISSELKRELVNRFGYNKEQIKLIYNGISKDKFNRKPSEGLKNNIKMQLNLPLEKPLLGFVGSLNKKKGIDILLEACSKITNVDFHIVLVGDGDKNWLLNLINKFRLDNKISVYPFQDPVKFYSIFDVFVLPSRKEGFPLVSIEAMMMGIPTIRSNVEGANDQIKHNINGFIFKNEDVQELSKYIRLLLQNNELRKNMGQKARLYATNKFSADIMINKLIQLYKEILE